MERNLEEHLEMSPTEAARLRLDRYIQAKADELDRLLPVVMCARSGGKTNLLREYGAFSDPAARKMVKPEAEAEERATEAARIKELLMEAVTTQTEAPAYRATITATDLARIEREMMKHRILQELSREPVMMTDWSELPRFEPLEKRCAVCGRVIEGGSLCGMCIMFGAVPMKAGNS